MSKSRIEMTIICNSLKDAAMIEDVVKGTASTYAIRTVNGDAKSLNLNGSAGRTVIYAGGKKNKGILGKDLAVQFAKNSPHGKFKIYDLNKHAMEKYHFAESSMQSKVDILVKEGRMKKGEGKGVYQFVK